MTSHIHLPATLPHHLIWIFVHSHHVWLTHLTLTHRVLRHLTLTHLILAHLRLICYHRIYRSAIFGCHRIQRVINVLRLLWHRLVSIPSVFCRHWSLRWRRLILVVPSIVLRLIRLIRYLITWHGRGRYDLCIIKRVQKIVCQIFPFIFILLIIFRIS